LQDQIYDFRSKRSICPAKGARLAAETV
jgi:hypothetical protein